MVASSLPRAHVQRGKVISSVVVVVNTKLLHLEILAPQWGLRTVQILPFIGHAYQPHLLMHNMCILSTVWTAHAQGQYEVQKGHRIMNQDLGISASGHCCQDVENGEKVTSSINAWQGLRTERYKLCPFIGHAYQHDHTCSCICTCQLHFGLCMLNVNIVYNKVVESRFAVYLQH